MLVVFLLSQIIFYSIYFNNEIYCWKIFLNYYSNFNKNNYNKDAIFNSLITRLNQNFINGDNNLLFDDSLDIYSDILNNYSNLNIDNYEGEFLNLEDLKTEIDYKLSSKQLYSSKNRVYNYFLTSKPKEINFSLEEYIIFFQLILGLNDENKIKKIHYILLNKGDKDSDYKYKINILLFIMFIK